MVLPSFLPRFFWGGRKCVTEDKDWKKEVILLQYCKWNLTLVEFLKKIRNKGSFFFL